MHLVHTGVLQTYSVELFASQIEQIGSSVDGISNQILDLRAIPPKFYIQFISTGVSFLN